MLIGCTVNYNFLQEILLVYPNLPLFQFFTHNTKPYEQTTTTIQLEKFKIIGLPMYIHTSFNVVFDQFFGRKPLSEQYNICRDYGCKGLVLHIPRKPVEDLIKGFKKVVTPNMKTDLHPPILYLEHVPGEYASPELLKELYDGLKKTYPYCKFGICIDTCHIYSSGYDLRNTAIMAKYLAEIEAIKAPILVHLNDSIGELGSLVDHHGAIGTKIWDESNYDSLKLLLSKPWHAIIELKSQEEIVQSLSFITPLLDKPKSNKYQRLLPLPPNGSNDY